MLDHVQYDCDQAYADECRRAVDHDTGCDVNDLVVVECSSVTHSYYIYYSYILSGDQRNTLAKVSIRSRSGPASRTVDRSRGPGPGPGKVPNPAQDPTASCSGQSQLRPG